MEFVYKNRKAHVRIELKEPPVWVSMADLHTLPQHVLPPSLCPVVKRLLKALALRFLELKRPL